MAIYGKEIRDALDALQWQCDDDVWTFNATIHCDSNLLYPILTKDTTNLNKRVSGIYYYHPDHLGSATWITNSSGTPVQFIHYMPFGELWYNRQASAYNERFKFTGKERDTETGYDYFGARYYSSALPMWLSVDPLSDKYPNISPYAYCNWNPVKYVDPDGKGVFPSATALRIASTEVMNDPKYCSQGRTTFCNMGAQAINRQTGDDILTGRANDMGIFLRNPQNATTLTQSEALEYANMGAVVFASYVSNGNEPGHIAIVAPTNELSYSAQRKEYVVSVFNIGKNNGEMSLSEAFGKRDVGLYILKRFRSNLY